MSLFRRNSLPIPNNDEYPSQSILLNPIPPSQQQQRSSSRTRSIRSASITSSSSQSTSMASCSYTPSSSAKVSFAPLPEVPPELKRRNSITLGVAARKNLLIGQGSAPVQRSPGVPNSNGVRKVYMTDEEWEEYKKAFDKKNGADAVDLGELAKSGAKNLWRKVRSSSVSSTTSASSFQSGSPNSQTSDLSVMNATQPKVLASPRRLFGNRKLSTPSRSSGDVLGFNDPRMAVEELGTVHEEERSRPTSPRISGLELDTGVHPHSINLATGAPALSPTRESIEEWRNTSKSSDPDQEQVSPSDLPVRRRSPPPLPAQSFDEEDEDESDLVSERAS